MAARRWLPFTLRLYFYAGSDSLRVLHTIVFDGDESKDFIRGIGLRFSAPLTDALHDRHVRFVGEQDGLFAEAVRGLTGLRRDPGQAAREAQIEGPPPARSAPVVSERSAVHPGVRRLDAAAAERRTLSPSANAPPTATHGSTAASGASRERPRVTSVVPPAASHSASAISGRAIRRSSTSATRRATRPTVTMWVWAPDAAPMDLRFYHDGLGQDTHEKQYKGGLEITYEDYEPGFGTPMGVARTSEMMLWILPATPARERFAAAGRRAAESPRSWCRRRRHRSNPACSAIRSRCLRRRAPEHAQLEQRLDWMFDFYRGQQDQRGWYGFWNYGDVMHTYDFDRHEWRYDIGGFAWDNSELATDLWLWLYFLRTGRADTFRFAEAMTRHTGEVDVHHLGRFAPLGSRHNVMHWGCSAKQLRISTALNRRYYYFLTGDERVGDLMREQIEAARTLRTVLATAASCLAPRSGRSKTRTATSRISASVPTGVRSRAPGSPSGSARAIRRCAIDCSRACGPSPRSPRASSRAASA